MDRRRLLMISAYSALPILGFIDAAVAGDGPHETMPIVAFYGIPALLAVSVGWMNELRWCAVHSVAMAGVAILAYRLIGIVGLSSRHAEPVTLTSAPWYLVGLLSVLLSGALVGGLARLLIGNWRAYRRKDR